MALHGCTAVVAPLCALRDESPTIVHRGFLRVIVRSPMRLHAALLCYHMPLLFFCATASARTYDTRTVPRAPRVVLIFIIVFELFIRHWLCVGCYMIVQAPAARKCSRAHAKYKFTCAIASRDASRTLPCSYFCGFEVRHKYLLCLYIPLLYICRISGLMSVHVRLVSQQYWRGARRRDAPHYSCACRRQIV